MEKLAVVILNYNGSHYLQKFLPTVLAHSSNYSVYVADNFSTDNSISLLKDQFPSVKLIEFDKNYGFSEGYNRALENIPAEYYMLLNSDVEVTTGWLDPMVELLDKIPVLQSASRNCCSITIVPFSNMLVLPEDLLINTGIHFAGAGSSDHGKGLWAI
jgi:GT2 family glycosyltransferase